MLASILKGAFLIKVSVILTSYNRPKLILESIQSLLNQTYENWEVLIVDDNSNEETQQVINQFAHSESRCTIIQSGVTEEDRPNSARYATCINLAIPKLTGDFVSYLTDDDIYYPDRLKIMVSYFMENPHVHVVYGNQEIIQYVNDQPILHFIRRSIGVTRSPFERMDHNSVMHRKTCFEIVKKWDDSPEHWPRADGIFFSELAKHWDFYPLDVVTDQKRIREATIGQRFLRGGNPWSD